jgi:U3 small nucleolar RNA-associated protein MPP10
MPDKQTQEVPPVKNLEDFLSLLSQPEDAAIQLLWNKNQPSPNETEQQTADLPVAITTLLRRTCSSLFQEIESLGQKYSSLVDQKQRPLSLSGLDQLYTGDDDDDALVDAETLWGQVELQNSALHKLLKRSVKQMAKADAVDIRLLEDIVETEEESDEQGDDNEDHEDDENSSSEASDDEDEETKRIRERMKRTMKDMDEDDDDGGGDDSSDEEESVKKSAGSDGVTDEDIEKDPDAVNLHDGFFNLQEMEAFADEEEEYLPEDAYGPVHPEADDDQPTDKRSFHQKQRDGDVDGGDSHMDDEDNDEEEGNTLLFRKETTVRRRKYREDDEVDALYSLYEAPADEDDEGDDSDNDVVNMTAADLFGKPNRKYYEKWNSKTGENTFGAKGDDDSWNDYDFDRDEQKTGWNDEEDHDDDDSSKGRSEEESEDERGHQGEHDSDEDVPMKGNNKRVAPLQEAPTKQAAKLLAQTEQLEKEMLAEKPWQMTGETGSSSRPLNSLLDSTPEFEVASKMAPVITVEHTADLEEVIKSRILAEDWDDVVPRELPDVGWHKKRGELPEVSQEKAKLGLGELYEREYLKKAVGYDVDAAEKQTEEEKAKNEMKTLFANLCSKLDALSNYHFAPRPIADEAEIRPLTMPAIAMEEILPVHVSDARGVAPEEVYGAKRGREAILRDDSELNQQERKRVRGSKKAARRKARQAKLADEKLISRLQPGLGLNNPYEKRKMREELSMARAGGRVTTGVVDTNDYGASGTFFKRMQQEAEQAIRGEKDELEDKKPAARVSGKSSALKL